MFWLVQKTNSIQELGAEDEICTSDGGSERILKKNAHKVVVKKPDGKRLPGRLQNTEK
jgi:hypothetical protein